MSEQIIRIGHSPDPDDAFIFYGIAKGLAGVEGFKIVHIIESIETLNERAREGELEMTAVSAAAFANLTDRYALLSCGGSFGRNYGPVVISKNKTTPGALKGKAIAVPGEQTTAYLLSRLFLPSFIPLQLPFDKIFDAVENGQADAGVVIHEGQLTYDSLGFHSVLDLGHAWAAETSLPLPLGLDVVRKNLGNTLMMKIWKCLKDSIVAALKNPEEALEYALEFGRGLNKSLGKRFISMYANKDSEEMGEEGIEALRFLYEKAVSSGFMPKIPAFDIIKG